MIDQARQKSDTVVRCAIYTRKSTTERLDREFNTLDAQREAAEAYVTSQRHEGWECLPNRYDDGGFSGGNIERPAVRQLLADIRAGKIDCVVVYKVDRLSRSLVDFARMMETFEQHNVSFVSVTQHFNTAQSMGRLTLNILLSFAQFEREIISERTRDKMAAARRKGKWVGGRPVLGYDIDREARRLVVNEKEAKRVREIFGLYLEQGGLIPTVRELARRGWSNKSWTTREGTLHRGKPFNKGTLHYLITNVTYRGRIKYEEKTYKGEHKAIVPHDLFRRVQRHLTENRRAIRVRRTKGEPGLLQGLIYCGACGARMTHTYTEKRPRRYRYYSCSTVLKSGVDSCPTRSIPAEEIEQYVVQEVRGRLEEMPVDEAAWESLTTREQREALGRVVERIDYDERRGDLAIHFLPARSEEIL